ncbi:DUF1152 domain-containing protein [Streptomyces chrestomyceticus]|uniref:DUF1152 domain-containing protein n=1 Tax=Streptomyces chrestomyceticus TaxID=68185 RepID=UPI0033FB8A95
MTRLIVAAGGGGDAVAAAMVDAALHGTENPALIFTYAWDRLLVDPVPGPRGPTDFTGLRPLTATVPTVPATARPIPPAGSTLPRLAAELPHTFAVIDPHHGAQGILCQLRELIDHLAPESIDLLDVGGDILAHGDEPTLRSPLGDALTLAACAQVDAPVRLLVAGPGLDGELPAAALRPRLGPVVLSLTPAHTERIMPVLKWHPSEATAMLAATARGARGLCRVRDAGLQIPLTDGSPTVHQADLQAAFHHNVLAHALVTTTTLHEAEHHARTICGTSEIDYERAKSARQAAASPVSLSPESVQERLTCFEAQARAHSITHTTFRHLSEVIGMSGDQTASLRELLHKGNPELHDSLLWPLPRRHDKIQPPRQ